MNITTADARKKKIRIGTRGSALALCQAKIAINELARRGGDEYEFEIVKYTTTGDKILDRKLYDIGGKALFLKEIEQALFDGEIDIAVHSLKDVPGLETPGTKIAGLLQRYEGCDVLVSKCASSIEELPTGAVVGTSSMRRLVMLRSLRPDIVIKDLRGNVPTRINKLLSGEYDAIILAACGLIRLDLMDHNICHSLDHKTFIPAVGQGMIALQVKAENEMMADLCQRSSCKTAAILASIERAFLAQLNATCKTPAAAHAYFASDAQEQIEAYFMLAGQDLVPHTIHVSLQLKESYPEGKEYIAGIEAAKLLQDKVRKTTELL